MRRKSKTMLLITAALTGAAGTMIFANALVAAQSDSAQSENAATSYSATLLHLPNTSGSGQASLRLSADRKTLLVHIVASGLEAGGMHISHIHGLASNSTCPTLAQDTDGDTFVELVEGQATYGPILVDFMNIDPNQDGVIDFRTTIHLTGNEGILPLADRHIVVHGMSVGAVGALTPGEVDGTAGYKTVLPVLCGEIVATGTKADPFQFRNP